MAALLKPVVYKNPLLLLLINNDENKHYKKNYDLYKLWMTYGYLLAIKMQGK